MKEQSFWPIKLNSRKWEAPKYRERSEEEEEDAQEAPVLFCLQIHLFTSASIVSSSSLHSGSCVSSPLPSPCSLVPLPSFSCLLFKYQLVPGGVKDHVIPLPPSSSKPKSVWIYPTLPPPCPPTRALFSSFSIFHLQPPHYCSKMSKGKWGNQDIVTPKRYLMTSPIVETHDWERVECPGGFQP